MSSQTSALGSSAANYFNGMSNFSQDLNNAISRAVQIAGLPVQLLQNDVKDLTNQYDELQTLNGDFGKMQPAVTSLSSAAGKMLTAKVSDPSIATVTLASNAAAGSYRLQVGNLGSYSNALSNDALPKVTNPATQNIAGSHSFTLQVTHGAGTPASIPISYSGGNLNGLAQAINLAGAGVDATVLNVGSSSAPDYRLSLQSSQLGPVTMQLNDGTNNLLSSTGAPGVLALYTVNGKQVQSDSDTVTLAPGVTVQLTGSDLMAASTVTVAADPSGVGTALQSFVSAYNSVMSELNNNRGQTPVALSGQAIVYDLTNQARRLANYSIGGGGLSSLASLGVKFSDMTGQLSFDQDTFDSATRNQAAALTEFLGSVTGGGFLKTATDTMTSIVDPTRGSVTQAIDTIRTQMDTTNSAIIDKQLAVTALQNKLTQQMAAADTLIYSLQQQNTQLQNMFTAMYYRSVTY